MAVAEKIGLAAAKANEISDQVEETVQAELGSYKTHKRHML